MTKAKNVASNTVKRIKDAVKRIKKTAAIFKEKLDKFLNTAKDNPLYIGLIGITVFVLCFGIYFIYTGDFNSMMIYAKGKIVKAADMFANLANWIKRVAVNTTIWIKDVTTNFLDIVKDHPILFILLGIAVICLVIYFIYTRHSKRIKETAAALKEKLDKFLDATKDKPLYFGLIGIAVFVLCLVIYLLYNLVIWIKEVTAILFDFVKEHPTYFSILVVTVFILCLGIFFIYTRQPKKNKRKVQKSTKNSEASDQADSYVTKAKNVAMTFKEKVDASLGTAADTPLYNNPVIWVAVSLTFLAIYFACRLVIWIHGVITSFLHFVINYPIFFSLLVVTVFVLCLVVYYIYTRHSKKREQKISTKHTSLIRKSHTNTK